MINFTFIEDASYQAYCTEAAYSIPDTATSHLSSPNQFHYFTGERRGKAVVAIHPRRDWVLSPLAAPEFGADEGVVLEWFTLQYPHILRAC
jgi:hypothetical protein